MRVSVTIPTFNSARTIRSTLESLRDQTLKDVTVTIVDSFSTDETLAIAREFTDSIVSYKGKVLGARKEGFLHCPGDYHLILDSDQVLEHTVLERCLQMIDRYDMMCIEERSLDPSTWVERLFDADRTLLHKNMGSYIDSVSGVMCPRFYRSDILAKAFANLPEYVSEIHAYEDAIIFYEASKYSDRVGLVKNGVWHHEPKNLSELWRKNYKYGRDVRHMHELMCYQDLVGKKERFRKFDRSEPVLSMKANMLLVLKGVPYMLGYKLGHRNR